MKKLNVFITSILVMVAITVINANPVNAEEYVIQANDTLWGISNEYGCSIEELMLANGLQTDIIIEGTTINIPENEEEVEFDVSNDIEDVEEVENIDNSSIDEENAYETGESNEVLYTANIYCSLGDASYWNISLAAEYLKNYVIYPGEEFSWERILGGNTYEQGYVAGGAFSGGKTVQSPGGGVCVLSTALMQAARGAGLTITEKWPHSMPVSYAYGDDEAAVSYGSKDLKFYNGLDYPVKFEFNISHTNTIVSVVRY